MHMNWILFAVAVVLELVYLLMFALTIRRRDFRFWPPPSQRSWQFFAAWFLAMIVAVNFLCLGFLDFDSAWLPDLRSRFPVAVILFLLASAIGTWVYTVVGTLGVILNLLAPFTEEPWLEERFGDAYREYRERVPRFIRLVK
jgi:protein-S-isoprenylcysteine O-methyltransferase Ste14